MKTARNNAGHRVKGTDQFWINEKRAAAVQAIVKQRLSQRLVKSNA